MGNITHWLEADEPPRCQHCPHLADERSFMCEDCSGQADEEVDTLREHLRGAVEALKRYGTHDMRCGKVTDDYAEMQPPRCTCGYDAILHRLGGR